MPTQPLPPVETPSSLVVLHDRAAVAAAIEALAPKIVQRYGAQDVLFVSLLNSGPIFSTLLMMAAQRLDSNFHPEVTYMKLDTYGEGQVAKESVVTQGLLPGVRLTGRLVVILDDVLDSGNSTVKTEEYLRKLGAKDVEVVVMVQKDRPRKAWQEATLFGLKAPDEWLVGMGMNGAPGLPAEAYRFADYIGVIR